MVLVQCAAGGRLRELLGNTGVLVMSVLHVRRIGVQQAQANAEAYLFKFFAALGYPNAIFINDQG